MGMGRPAYGQGQGSFFGRRPTPMRNPTPYFPSRVGGLSGFFGGLAGGRMANKPPPFMPQSIPQRPQMPMDGGYDGSGIMGGLMAKMPTPPMNQDQTPSDGGFLSQLVSSPMMQRPMPPMRGPLVPEMRGPQMPPMKRPGGPGKARTGGGLMRRGRGSLMRGGPGKGRGQMQQPMPARPSFDQLMTQGPMNMPQSPFMTQQGLGQTGQLGQIGNSRPAPPPDFGQARTQGPMNMPQPSGFGREFFGQMRPPSNIQFQQVGNNRPLPSFMGEVGQARTQGPSSMLQSPFMMQQGGMRFYGGGITDLY